MDYTGVYIRLIEEIVSRSRSRIFEQRLIRVGKENSGHVRRASSETCFNLRPTRVHNQLEIASRTRPLEGTTDRKPKAFSHKYKIFISAAISARHCREIMEPVKCKNQWEYSSGWEICLFHWIRVRLSGRLPSVRDLTYGFFAFVWTRRIKSLIESLMSRHATNCRFERKSMDALCIYVE